MFSICQHLFTLGVEMDFTRNGDFTWRVSDFEELVGVTPGDDGVGFREFSFAMPHSHMNQ